MKKETAQLPIIKKLIKKHGLDKVEEAIEQAEKTAYIIWTDDYEKEEASKNEDGCPSFEPELISIEDALLSDKDVTIHYEGSDEDYSNDTAEECVKFFCEN